MEHIAALTDQRDRELLRVTLVEALMHTVHIESCSVFDVVGEGDDRRWLNCASQDRGGVTEVLDSTWIDTAPLPRLPQAPERLRCLTSQREYSAIAFNQEATVFRTWMPLFSDARYCDQSVLEIDSSLELTIADKSAVKCLLCFTPLWYSLYPKAQGGYC